MGSLEQYSDELKATAASIVKPGMGLLACDESTGTVGTRLESIGVENVEANRALWRNLLFTTKGLNEYISGCILFEETLYQDAPGGGDKETWCSGLDGLDERCAKAYAGGARFAKWRTAVRINEAENLPTPLAVKEAAWGLARYARVCQENGLVPIVEPEVLIDGIHDQARTAVVQEDLITTTYKYLQENGVMLEGTLLKPSMTVSGVDCPNKPTPTEVATMTV